MAPRELADVEVGPLYFRQVNAPFHIVFREGGRGRISRLFTDYTPQFGYEKVDWYETTAFNALPLLGCVLVFLSTILIALIRAIRSRLGREHTPASRGERAAWWIVLGIAGLDLLSVVGSILWGDPRPVSGIPMTFQIVLGLGVLSAVLTAVAPIATVLVWTNRYWGVVARAYHLLVTAAAVAFIWFLDYWNLLGWRF